MPETDEPKDQGRWQSIFRSAVDAIILIDAHGRIEVRLHSTASLCQVTVHHTGPGIPADVLGRIFTPFFTTKARGTGLGLPTAKRLVEAHAGTIAVTCRPEGGTTVVVELPQTIAT
jgi:signal transduction histidine kinase